MAFAVSLLFNAEMADAIRQMVPSLFPDGKFVGKEAYAGMLAQQNMTIDQFESDLRRQVAITRLRDIALEGIVVTQAEIEAAFRKKNEKIKVEFVRLTADKYKAESQPSEQEIEAFFNANTSRSRSVSSPPGVCVCAPPAARVASLVVPCLTMAGSSND